MSKVNKRKEIKQKEDFQLKFQLALSASNDKVLSWLPKSLDAPGIDKEDVSSGDKHSFLDLPVIPSGAGLSELDDANKSFGTIGSFVNAEVLPKSQQAAPPSRENRTGSKAMSALMNKMRTEKRNTINSADANIRNQPDHRRRSKMMDELKSQKQSKKAATASSALEVDSDEEESKARHISAKPKILPTGKKGKGRPF